MIGTLVRFGKRAAWRLACACGLHHVWRRRNARRLLIVNYHGARDDANRRRAWLLVPRRSLEEQLDYLSRHYRVLPLDDALERLWTNRLDEPTAAITFDDGYRNNLTIAAPLLARHRFPATIYLATGLIGTPARLWTTEVDLAFEDTRATAADLTSVGIGKVSLGTPAERSHACSVAKRLLKSLSDDERARAIAEIKHRLATTVIDPADDFALMSWDEVQQMARDGLTTFGGHTVHHVILSRSTDDAVVAEIRESVTAVREKSNGVSETFAYPNGRRVDFDGRAQDALRALGVRAAVTTIEGLNDPETDRFALRRVAVGDDMTLADFKLRTSGFLPAFREQFGREPDA